MTMLFPLIFQFKEVEPIFALSFHPGGEFLLVATKHPTLRLYNIETQQCYVCSIPTDQHRSTVTDVWLLIIT